MAHDSYQLLVSLSFDGMLSADEQDQLNQHMQTCAPCAAMWTHMNAFDRLMSSQIEVAPPSDFVLKVMHKVENYQVRRRWTPWMVAILVIFSILASLSLAWPALVFSSGFQNTVLSWPVTASVLGYAGSALTVIIQGATFATNALIDWLFYLSSNPPVLGVVIAALVIASTYIGLREGFKASDTYQQQSA